MLRNFTVIYDDAEYPVARALDPQDAARMACDRIWNDTGGEAFEVNGKPTRLTVRDEDREITVWDIHVEMAPHYWAQAVSRGQPSPISAD